MLALATLGSCVAPRTQIVVLVDTDYNVPVEVGSLRVTVSDPNGVEPTVRSITLAGTQSRGCVDGSNAARFCVPLTFLLVPQSQRPDNKPVEVRIEAMTGTDGASGRTLVTRTARLPFALGHTLRLPMFLARACEAVQCGDGFTCIEGGQCVAVDQPPGVISLDPTTGQALTADASAAMDATDGTDASDRTDATQMQQGRPDTAMGAMGDAMRAWPDSAMGAMGDAMRAWPEAGMPADVGRPSDVGMRPDAGMPADAGSHRPDGSLSPDVMGALDASTGADVTLPVDVQTGRDSGLLDTGLDARRDGSGLLGLGIDIEINLGLGLGLRRDR